MIQKTWEKSEWVTELISKLNDDTYDDSSEGKDNVLRNELFEQFGVKSVKILTQDEEKGTNSIYFSIE